jgi:membrane protease YdiL (CAAX protease family)
MADLMKGLANGLGERVYADARDLNTGPVEQRLRFVVLAGELAGPQRAQEQLDALSRRLDAAGKTMTPAETDVERILRRLYRDYRQRRFQAPSLAAEDKDVLREELGWFGDLALAPAGGPDRAAREEVMQPAHRTAIVLLVSVAALGSLGLLGFIGLMLVVIFLFMGKLHLGLHCGAGNGGIYAETFALWLVLFQVLNIVAAIIPEDETRLLRVGVAFLLSLLALVWPVLRGIPWRQVRWEVGLRLGKQPALEPLLGGFGYAIELPLFAVGFLCTFILLKLQGVFPAGYSGDDFGPSKMPTHPIIQYVSGGDWWMRAQVLLLASVIAPIVEETMFRGVLYRHLREATCAFPRLLSVVVSGTVASFIFAVVHPQGLVTVPALMAIAYALTLIREWRGALIASMVTHGIHNAVLVTIATLIFSQ